MRVIHARVHLLCLFLLSLRWWPPPPHCRLISACWDADPSKRPPFTEVLERLEAMQNELGAKGKSASIMRAANRGYGSGQPACCGQCTIL